MNKSPILYYIPIAILVLLAFRGFSQSGVIWKDDYVPLNPKFAFYSLFTWNSEEHGGTLNEHLNGIVFSTVYFVMAHAFGVPLASRVYVVGTILLISLSMFLAVSTMQSLNGQKTNWFACLLGSLIFTINPWTTSRILSGHFPLLLSYAFAPLFMAYLVKAIMLRKRMDTLAASILLAAAGAAILHGYIIVALASAIVVIWAIIFLNKKIVRLLMFVQIIVISVLLLMFWILPTYYNRIAAASMFPTVTEEPYHLSRNANFLEVIRLMGYFWEPYDKSIYSLDLFSSSIWFTLSFLTPVIVLFSFSISKKRLTDVRVPLFLILLLALTLGQGTRLLGDYYIAFVNLPLLQVLRDPNKILFLGSLSSGFLIGLSIDDFLALARRLVGCYRSARRLFSSRFVSLLNRLSFINICIVLVILTVNFPWLTGDFRGYFSPQPMPSYVYEADSFLNRQEGDFRVLYLPIRTGCINFTWGRGANEPVRYTSTKPILNPPYSVTYEESPYTSLYLNYVSSALWNNVTRRIGAVLGLANVKYVVARKDVIPVQESLSFLRALLTQEDLKLVWSQGAEYIFEVQEWLPKLRVAQHPVLVLGGFRGLLTLPYSGISFGDKFLMFPETGDTLDMSLERKPIVFIDSSRWMDLFFSQIGVHYAINIKQFADGSNWVIDSWLQTIDLDMTQEGKGLSAITTEPLQIRFETESPGDYRIFVRAYGDPSILDLDGRSIIGMTEGWSQRGFHWLSSQLELLKGTHVLSVGKSTGLLGIDRIVVIPDSAYQALLARFWENQSNSRIIQHVEAEYMDNYDGQYVTTSDSDIDLMNNAGILLCENGSANLHAGQLITVPQAGPYTIRARAATSESQSAELGAILKNQKNGKECIINIYVNGSEIQLYQSSPVTIDSGDYSLTLKGHKIILDFLDILPSELSELYENSSVLISSRMNNPSDYYVSLESPSNGSFLVFSESFYGSWRLQTDDASQGPIHADLFAMAFRITSPDSLQIIVSNESQKYGFAGTVVSLTTMCALIVLSVDIRKKKKLTPTRLLPD